jgi:pyrroline-5-carboxylate reductase
MRNLKLAIIGGGNIGQAIAKGLKESGKSIPQNITITRRQVNLLEQFQRQGFIILGDNKEAVRKSKVIFIAVRPNEVVPLLKEIKSALDPKRHIIISVATGVGINDIEKQVGSNFPIIRAMPNIAIAIKESMTCLANNKAAEKDIKLVKAIFDLLGKAVFISEELMVPATVLCACGTAFFIRSIRAASQGGIEIGFHPEDAILMAAQTAKGAAFLILDSEEHPEAKIDEVTTPRGCTIAGLNQMEHSGFSSAMIKGILTSTDKANELFKNKRG